jgi:hypothetical protein
VSFIYFEGAPRAYLFYSPTSSVSESLTQGIPLIIWPMDAEQPINTAFLSVEPSPVAIEPFQVHSEISIPCQFTHRLFHLLFLPEAFVR